MPFRIRERETEEAAEWIAEWPFSPRSHFIASNAYEILLRELGRYVRGEVPGRSFLISGHRGSGKTTMVRQAVEKLGRDILKDAVDKSRQRASITAEERTLSLQRPLLVKLHGPSLLGPRSRAETKNETKKEDTQPEAKGDDSKKAKANEQKDLSKTTAAETKPRVNDVDAALNDPTAFALVQITIGLYRALTAEFSRSFTNHAREQMATQPRTSASDYLEFAGQFTLDLDNAPRAGTLRSYFQRLKRVEAGVLWPYEIGRTMLRRGLDDQGIREIVALATAAQAFEVCSGDVTDKQTRKDSLSREQTAESKVEASLKDVANKVLGLGAGVAVGLGSVSALGYLGGAAAGAATGLLSTLTLSWTNKRSRKDEQVLDYTFIRRRDKETLERDLPLVIQRIRDAGLAPVFVIDELDKLPDPKTAIANLIQSLKHLTTDYGFFCFLTDRDYFDYVTQKVTKEAFPVEHSFFSHRMFILYQPRQLLKWLRDITKIETAPAGSSTTPSGTGTTDDMTAQASFGLLMLHRSKLNLVEVLRKIAEECDADGRVRPTSTKLVSDPGFSFAATIQLVIGLILRGSSMRERVENEPRFMQRAIDALYIMSRAWEDEEPTVRLDRSAIVKCLLERCRTEERAPVANGRAATPATPEAPAKRKWTKSAQKKAAVRRSPAAKPPSDDELEKELVATGMSARDIELVVKAVGQLADLFSDYDRLIAWLETQTSQDADEAVFRGIRPPGRLIELVKADTREYKFLVDVYGQDIETREALAGAAAQAAAAGIQPQVAPPSPPGAGAPPAAQPAPTAPPLAPAAAAPEVVPPVPPSSLPPPIETEMQELADSYDNLNHSLRIADIRLRDLIQFQFMPPSINPDELTLARERFADSLRTHNQYEELSKDISQLRSLMYFVGRNGIDLSVLFQLTIKVAQDVRSVIDARGGTTATASGIDALCAIARYVDPRAVASLSPGPVARTTWQMIQDLPIDLAMRDFAPVATAKAVEQLRYLATQSVPSPVTEPRIVWNWAADRVCNHVVKYVHMNPVQYEEIVYAAAGLPPSRFLRGDLRQMTLAEWSEFCLYGFPDGEDAITPLWPFVAGLSILGFDRHVVEAATKLPFVDRGLDGRKDLFEDFKYTASEKATPGIVLVIPEDGPSIATGPEGWRRPSESEGATPVLAVSKDKLSRYSKAFDWLTKQGAITRLIHEREESGFS